MSAPAQTADTNCKTVTDRSESDALRQLTRTLQFHLADEESQSVFARLQTLKNALDQQETTLLGWPDSPSRDRICKKLGDARNMVVKMIDDYSNAARKHPAGCSIKTI
jgi:hypothetical protein